MDPTGGRRSLRCLPLSADRWRSAGGRNAGGGLVSGLIRTVPARGGDGPYAQTHLQLDPIRLGRFKKPGKRVLGNGPGRHTQRAGWEAVHICIDDATRLAYLEVLPDEQATTTVGFMERAIAWFAERGVRIRQVMSDNGSPYVSKPWAMFCADHHIEHIRTRRCRPRTNGKAERFIQTMLREWAYAATYQSSAQRQRALPA